MGLKQDKVAEGWRKVYSVELRNLCYSPDTNHLRKTRSMKYVACMEEIRNIYKMLVRNYKKSNTTLVIYFFIADGQQAATHFDHSCSHLQALFLQGKM